MKTPEEIKRGLECCRGGELGCSECPYDGECHLPFGNDPEADAIAYIQQLEAKEQRWISVDDRLPQDFVSVIAHMTDAGEFPDVREAYAVCGMFFFPALHEHHPVDYWMEMPELQKEEV